MAGLAVVLVSAFNLNSIASIGSAVALLVFSAVTLAHFQLYSRRVPTSFCWSSP